ncbi:hypothetical protein OTU49_005518, partial [Cherax quadricarinatus]
SDDYARVKRCGLNYGGESEDYEDSVNSDTDSDHAASSRTESSAHLDDTHHTPLSDRNHHHSKSVVRSVGRQHSDLSLAREEELTPPLPLQVEREWELHWPRRAQQRNDEQQQQGSGGGRRGRDDDGRHGSLPRPRALHARTQLRHLGDE